MTNANETKITVQKTDAGWTASNLPGETFQTRQAARDASKMAAGLAQIKADWAPAGWDKIEADDDSTVIADGALVAVEGSTWEAPAVDLPHPVATVADPALVAAQMKIAELTAKLEAAQAAPPAIEGAEEVLIVLPVGHALPDARRRRTVYEADAEGVARFPTAASQAGEKVLYPPYAWGGEAHVAIANALSAAGFVAGDSLDSADLKCVPGGKPNQARWGSDASRNTARHRMTNAGMLIREAGGKRGVSYVISEAFFTPEAWPALAAAALADRANAPTVTTA